VVFAGDHAQENDTAIVSIEALNTFLDNFIKANGADLGVKKTVTGRDFEKSFKDGAGAPPSRKREQAAQAAGAYQHSAQSNVKGNLLHTTDSADNNAPIPTFQMNQEELRAAQKLQGNIKELRRRQIEYLYPLSSVIKSSAPSCVAIFWRKR